MKYIKLNNYTSYNQFMSNVFDIQDLYYDSLTKNISSSKLKKHFMHLIQKELDKCIDFMQSDVYTLLEDVTYKSNYEKTYTYYDYECSISHNEYKEILLTKNVFSHVLAEMS